MIAFAKVETPHRAIGASSTGSSQEEQLARAVRAIANPHAGFSYSEFVSNVAPRDAQRLFEWSEVLKDNRVWLQRVLTPGLEASAAELTKTTRAVFEVLARHGAAAISLQGFGPAGINGMHLAMVLRATAEELEGDPSWQRALAHARTALQDAGIDPAEALFGLLKAE